jgi:glycosyltransferase involved in cell wall biosynthesis
MKKSGLRLVVIPTDPISAYEKAGYDWLERYFNPTGMFDEVYALSPLEQGERKAHGMTIRGVPEEKFLHVLKEIRPHVVRAYGGFWPSDVACYNRLPGVPIVVSVHDTRPELMHPSLQYADLVICLTSEVEKRVLAVGTAPERIRRLPNRIDTKKFRPVQDEKLFQSVASRFPPGKHILQVGRKCREKNLDTIVRSLAVLPSDYSAIFVGQGDKTSYEALAKELGVSDRCFWLSSIKNSELPIWYSWSDCFCLPSRFPSEGFPIVSIEAAACGAAIVVSDIPPMNEYMVHDESACLVKDYEDPKQLAAAIQKTCEGREYRRTISEGAVRMAQQFDLPLVDAMEVAIYREALSLRPPPIARRLKLTIINRRHQAANSPIGSQLKRLLGRA